MPPRDPFTPLGPERDEPPAGGTQSPRHTDVPAQTFSSGTSGSARKASRFDDEVERLRKSPTPAASSLSSIGVPLMGIFSRTRDIIAANFRRFIEVYEAATP